MRIAILSIILFTLSSCMDKSVVGTYESKDYSNLRIMWMYHKNILVPRETTLIVNKDSSFIYESCGNMITGQWKVEDDSLYLFAETNRWRNDSLNEYGWEGRHPKVGTEPTKYGISKKSLIQSWHQEIDGKRFKMIEKLVK